MNQSHYETIRIDRRGRVLTITMNRPDVLNAVNAKLHSELSQVFTDAARDPARERPDRVVRTLRAREQRPPPVQSRHEHRFPVAPRRTGRRRAAAGLIRSP